MFRLQNLFRAALRLYEGGKYDAALTGFERAAKSAPEHPAHIEYLGRTLLALGKNDAALTRFQQLSRKPGFETLRFDVRVQPDRSITFRGEMKPVP